MHVHASDKELSENRSAKLWVYSNGNTKIESRGNIAGHDMNKIRQYIKLNYKEMYAKWQRYSKEGFYQNK